MDKKKDYITKTFRLRRDLAEKLDRHREETGAPATFTVEKALEAYFGKMDGERDGVTTGGDY